MTTAGQKYYGIYRGTVVNNIDPLQTGRIMAIVPDVGGITPSTWAMPSMPFTGKQSGAFMVPQIGSGVWIQFEAGDCDRPVWTGGWWGNAAEVPALALAGVPGDPNIVMQTTLQNSLVISDLPGPTGGIMLKSTTGATIIVNDTGIYIQNGKGASIVMVGPTVTVNNGALVVV
ncbi:MAG: baseplate assembly protein [Gammaproteobacteria bacterium]|nr:baseplate assembly protein [Gammaproteobacteria bacterium]